MPVPCPDLMKWAMWFEKHENRIVEQTMVGKIKVSTVFFGLGSSIFSDSPNPLLFETMVFGGDHDLERERYRTWLGAESGHKRWVDKVTDSVNGIN